MKRLLCAILLLSRLNSVEKDRVGTIVVLAASKQKIVIGADSKAVEFSQTTGLRTDRYDECKMTTLNGKFVFATVGKSGHESVGHPEFSWDVFSIARKIARRNGKTSSLKSIAAAWGKEVSTDDNRDVRRGVTDSRSIPGQTGIFAGFESSQIVVYRVSVTKRATGVFTYRFRPTELGDGKVIPLGAIDIATELRAQQTKRSKSWISQFARGHESQDWITVMPDYLDFVIDKTIAHSASKDTVGKPIDLIEITNRGVHWIRKKNGCE